MQLFPSLPPPLWGVHTIQQTSSKCIQNTRANAGRLLEVRWTFVATCYNGRASWMFAGCFAGSLLDRVNTLLPHQYLYCNYF